MAHHKRELTAFDYRKYPFFKILYTETQSGTGVSMTRGVLVMIILASMATCCLISVTQSRKMEQFWDNLKGMHLEVMVLMIAMNECSNRPRVRRILAYIDRSRSISRYGLLEENKIMIKARSEARSDMIFFVTIFAVNFPLMMLTKPTIEALSGHSWKQLAFPWTILPSDDDLTFVAFLLFQTLGISFSHCLGISAMCFTTVTTQITALFDVVLLGIQQIEERAARKMTQHGLTYQESMLMCIKESIQHHQELVGEVRSEKTHLEGTFFADIINISMIMACEAFPIIQSNSLASTIKGIVFLLVQISTTALICDRMEIMADKNVEVFRALYNSPWYKCGVDYRRVVLNAMVFSRHPLTIKGRSFHGLTATRATFYSAMVNTFNLLNVIRKVS